jgi:hypothetical protein
VLKGRREKKFWDRYRTNKFYFGNSKIYAQCGPYALHTITKHPYEKLEKLSTKGHLGNAKLFAYLEKHGYEIHPVTVGNTVRSAKTLDNKSLLCISNVVLLDQMCIDSENTWAVLYNNILAHSGDVSPYNPMDLLNYPVQAAYVIWHDNWKS